MRILRRPLTIYYLQRYFASGWAFLIPYLAAYLLYYVTDWPVNPVTDAPLSPLTPPTPLTSPAPVPSLLHLYWVLHALHLALASYALWTWWRAKSAPRPIRAPLTPPSTVPVLQPQLPNFNWRNDALVRIAPWFLLALIFYIPGVYLEWPSDPWEHLRRINEWRNLDTVGAHSSWYKSSYFIPYSLLSWCIGLRQLFWLDFYYTGICLLLCWQYYKFARACGLGERASMVFVIIQALLFGNNIFSFYRYYGISSSIYAQLGAVALTRIVLEWAAWGTSLHRKAPSTPSPSPHTLSSAPSASYFTLHFSPFTLPSRPSFWHLPTLITLAPIALCLLSLTAFNHIQGIGIAGIGITAIIVWRLIEWKRAALWWLIGGTIAINALFLWLYPRPEIIEIYRAQGWLNAWYGFNAFNYSSEAFERVMQIASAFGLGYILSAFLLPQSLRAISCLILLPFAAISLPIFAILFCETSNSLSGPDNIVTFHRFLFASPCCLSLVGLLSSTKWQNRGEMVSCIAVVITLVSATLLPPNSFSYNRLWHSMVSVNNDLSLTEISKLALFQSSICIKTDTRTIGTYGSLAALDSLNGPSGSPRAINPSGVEILSKTVPLLRPNGNTREVPLYQHLHAPSIYLPTGYRPSISNYNIPLDTNHWISHNRKNIVFKNIIKDKEPAPAIQNLEGITSHPFTSTPTPITPTENYRLSITLRSNSTIQPTVYLAVAWYDTDKNFLQANIPHPLGAGSPPGWVSGTYSYFGLIDEPAPTEEHTYSIAFGIAEDALIPPNARYFTAGALLNYHSAPSAIVQILKVQLESKPPPVLKILVGEPLVAVSASSLAAQLSKHWGPQQSVVDRAGTRELLESLRRATSNCEVTPN